MLRPRRSDDHLDLGRRHAGSVGRALIAVVTPLLAAMPLNACSGRVFQGARAASGDGGNEASGFEGAPDGGDAPDGAGGSGGSGGGDCSSGLCVLADVPGYPDWIAVDASNVYWTNSRSGLVLRIPLAGGALTTLASGRGQFSSIAVDATNVYWTEMTVEYEPALVSLTKSGGAIVTLASGDYPIGAVLVDATDVYWQAGSDILKIPVGGGSPTTIVAGKGGDYFALNATGVFCAGEQIVRVDKSGGALVTLADGQNAGPVAADESYVYWTNLADGATSTAMKVSIAGGTPVALAGVAASGYAPAMVVDATNVSWTNGGQPGGPGTVVQVPVGGGSPTTLASAGTGTNSNGIAVGGGVLYWTVYDVTDVLSGTHGQVMRFMP